MALQSARHHCDVSKIYSVLMIALTLCLSAAECRPRKIYTCPVLQRCTCHRRSAGLSVACKSKSVDEKLHADMAKLQQLSVTKISFRSTNITELPALWFTSDTSSSLRVLECDLRVFSEAEVCCIKNLTDIRLDGTELQCVPIGLTAAKGVHTLVMQRNHIKRLQGMLDLPKLVRLDLSHNGIETIDEQYLSGLPKLQYLTLSYNSIHELQPNIFRKTVSLTHVNLNGNRISSVARVFSHLHRLEVSGQFYARYQWLVT